MILAGISVGFESAVYTAIVIGAAVYGAFLLSGSVFVALFAVSRLRDRPVREAAGSRSGFRQLAATLRGMRAYPLTLWFLGAYLLSGAISTLVALSIHYRIRQAEAKA